MTVPAITADARNTPITTEERRRQWERLRFPTRGHAAARREKMVNMEDSRAALRSSLEPCDGLDVDPAHAPVQRVERDAEHDQEHGVDGPHEGPVGDQ